MFIHSFLTTDISQYEYALCYDNLVTYLCSTIE